MGINYKLQWERDKETNYRRWPRKAFWILTQIGVKGKSKANKHFEKKGLYGFSQDRKDAYT